MATLAQINEFLGLKRLALIGVSHNDHDFSRLLFREFLRRGYDAIPVHPGIRELDGRRCFDRLQDVTPAVEGALLLTPPAVTDQIVEDCAIAGVRRIWMYRAGGGGAVSPNAVAYCASRGIDVIGGECPLMFFPDIGFIHRLHGMMRKITRHYPH
jgi:uncharacterized protein